MKIFQKKIAGFHCPKNRDGSVFVWRWWFPGKAKRPNRALCGLELRYFRKAFDLQFGDLSDSGLEFALQGHGLLPQPFFEL